MAKLRIPKLPKRQSKQLREGAPSNKRLLAEIMIGLAVLLLIGSAFAWWHYVYSDPKRVFESMIENNFRTTSVTRARIQQNQTQRLEQFARLENGAQNAATAKSILLQKGDVNAQVHTESIGTPSSDYVRYSEIETDQKNSTGQTIDFSSVKNIWGKSDSGEENVGDLYGDVVLGVIPIGDLSFAQRKAMMQLIEERGVYTVDYSKVERKVVSGRPQYTYMVQMDPEAYVNMLKQFGHEVGLQPLESLDPSLYHNQQKLTFGVTVDVWSHHLASIAYTDSNRVEGFGGYGVSKKIVLPADAETIPVQDLQERIQNLQ